MKTPHKMVGGKIVPLSADELARREKAKQRPRVERKQPEHPTPVTRVEFDALKAEVAALKKVK